jgi:hypothetical protein
MRIETSSPRGTALAQSADLSRARARDADDTYLIQRHVADESRALRPARTPGALDAIRLRQYVPRVGGSGQQGDER